MQRLCSGGVDEEIVKRCIVINSDGAGENRRFVRKNFGEGSLVEKLTVLIDEDLNWMREYTALGDKVRAPLFCISINTPAWVHEMLTIISFRDFQ